MTRIYSSIGPCLDSSFRLRLDQERSCPAGSDSGMSIRPPDYHCSVDTCTRGGAPRIRALVTSCSPKSRGSNVLPRAHRQLDFRPSAPRTPRTLKLYARLHYRARDKKLASPWTTETRISASSCLGRASWSGELQRQQILADQNPGQGDIWRCILRRRMTSPP